MDSRDEGNVPNVREPIGAVHGANLHAKQVNLLARVPLGVMSSASFGGAVIAQALVRARSLVTKHGIIQGAQLLSSEGINALRAIG